MIYCHLAYLTYMQSTSCEMLDWMNHKLESRLLGKCNNLRHTDDTILVAEIEEELNSLLMRVKEEGEKTGLKLSIQKTKTMASGVITSWQIDGGKWKQSQTISLGYMTFAPWKKSYDQPEKHIEKQRHHFADERM